MATSTSALTSFNGTSKFASSLQQALTRAVGIAALPLDTLNARQTTLDDRRNALQALDSRFAQLQTSITALQRISRSGTLNSSVSDGTVVSATVGSGATAGTYSIEVEGLGSFSSALSVAGGTPVSDPSHQGLSTETSFTLNAGGTSTSITATSSSLQDVASAINLEAGADVQASIVNVGSSVSPDYRLSLRATKLGTDAISLTDSLSANLISASTPGALATYKVEGTSTVTSDSRSVTLAPGVTVNLLSQSAVGVPATITVRNDAAGFVQAFSSFAQSYNSAIDTLNQFHGQNGGALQGDSLVGTLSGILSQLGGYNNGTPETAFANYGITLDKNGHLNIDSATLTSQGNANFSAFSALVGSSDGGGFLKRATDLLDTVENADSGLVKTAETSATAQAQTLQTRVAAEQTRLLQLQQSLIQQIAKADTAIAQLESQVSYVNGLFYSITGNNNGTGQA